MGFHHVAISTRDVKANHESYTGAMGFRLAKVQVGRAGERGFAKHLFYDAGDGQMIAFWDFHDPDLSPDGSPAISTGMGLPIWANHIAFAASDHAEALRLLAAESVELDAEPASRVYRAADRRR